MSNILEFRVSQSQAKMPVPPDGVRAAAQIVIFPGIRYERTPETVPPAPEGADGSRRKSRRGAK